MYSAAQIAKYCMPCNGTTDLLVNSVPSARYSVGVHYDCLKQLGFLLDHGAGMLLSTSAVGLFWDWT